MFRPGDIIPQSAPYSVYHAGHRPIHEVNASAGDVFPPCRVCQTSVRFRKLDSSVFFARFLLIEDPDFSSLQTDAA